MVVGALSLAAGAVVTVINFPHLNSLQYQKKYENITLY